MVVKNLPSQCDFVLTNREEALIDQLALLAKVSCAAPRRATTTFSTVFVIILAVHRDTIAKGAVPSRLKIDLTNYTQKDSRLDVAAETKHKQDRFEPSCSVVFECVLLVPKR